MGSLLSALFWEHDPNGLLVVDRQLAVRMVNPAFCVLFDVTSEEARGRSAADLIGDTGAFEQVCRDPAAGILRDEQSYPERNFHVQRIIFAAPGDEGVAAIFVDLTSGRDQSRHIKELREGVAREVRDVVDRQMAVAQEIAGLLGETTADSKVALLRLQECDGLAGRLPDDRNGAVLLARELLQADSIFLLVGEQVNPYYQTPLLPRRVSIRRSVLVQIVEVLKGYRKEVTVEWC